VPGNGPAGALDDLLARVRDESSALRAVLTTLKLDWIVHELLGSFCTVQSRKLVLAAAQRGHRRTGPHPLIPIARVMHKEIE